ncbi:hypothetical protein Patl1_17786 [Pistacia atlantica]|uniref:Uncharacterized protein n=1 Tax=Pistacia atlantica TaxID=434234 RepID=A0ACC1BZE3_9ROSI|nr:hypothetical protein Patl1_17786 [Pistacia atlantica]
MVMVFFFVVTTPFGIALGIVLSNTYKENSPISLISIGLLNASLVRLLIYMALIDLLVVDFMGQKLQGGIRLQLKLMLLFFLVLVACLFRQNGLEIFFFFFK